MALETRLLLFDRTASGSVYFLRVNNQSLLPHDVDIFAEKWRHLERLKDFGVCCHDNWIYVIGGFDLNRGRHSSAVKRYWLALLCFDWSFVINRAFINKQNKQISEFL